MMGPGRYRVTVELRSVDGATFYPTVIGRVLVRPAEVPATLEWVVSLTPPPDASIPADIEGDYLLMATDGTRVVARLKAQERNGNLTFVGIGVEQSNEADHRPTTPTSRMVS